MAESICSFTLGLYGDTVPLR